MYIQLKLKNEKNFGHTIELYVQTLGVMNKNNNKKQYKR